MISKFQSAHPKHLYLAAWKLAGCGVAVLSVAGCLAGCGKRKPSPNNISAVETNQSAAGSMATHEPVASTRMVATAPLLTPAGDPDMGELNRCLLRWVIANRRKPASFEEFAASANIAIPPAPAGKKYAIDKSTMHIVLIKA